VQERCCLSLYNDKFGLQARVTSLVLSFSHSPLSPYSLSLSASFLSLSLSCFLLAPSYLSLSLSLLFLCSLFPLTLYACKQEISLNEQLAAVAQASVVSSSTTPKTLECRRCLVASAAVAAAVTVCCCCCCLACGSGAGQRGVSPHPSH
jgi:hypothetical protein